MSKVHDLSPSVHLRNRFQILSRVGLSAQLPVVSRLREFAKVVAITSKYTDQEMVLLHQLGLH